MLNDDIINCLMLAWGTFDDGEFSSIIFKENLEIFLSDWWFQNDWNNFPPAFFVLLRLLNIYLCIPHQIIYLKTFPCIPWSEKYFIYTKIQRGDGADFSILILSPVEFISVFFLS